MPSIRDRLKASLILAPAILLMLVFITRFTGEETIRREGLLEYFAWAAAISLAVSYVVTLYVEYVRRWWAK